ncbi:5-(carboxyamino)imidazole ribonucleotide synthase [Pontibacter sp. G13]|uniref:5-(carboxyamino)imidazole ribonucleotide synthase n=1 Tax=Pontibacter sp. G13 TaxID=3074898 RepID=UPI00288BF37F|nr:5-(carboxyamino)imidazole ribonucleotide synthase [Pontibacter sp. G13]WNJ18877.1 5-(carboxyamino)imidazole ribonucleotide synthase [Pontibacter sp. G13]
MHHFYRDLKLGVLGGGQLGRMLIQAAMDFNLSVYCLDPAADAPCAGFAHGFTQGSLTNFDDVYQFGKDKDVVTIEIEHVNTEALEALQAEGVRVYPDPKHIRMIQDKRRQKAFFTENELPTSPFVLVENREEVLNHRDMVPMVMKLAEAGYDGRGVQVLKTESDLEQAFDAPGLLESFVNLDKEVAVIVARNAEGEVKTFPMVEMAFHPVHNLVEFLLAPAEVEESIQAKGAEMAVQLVESMGYVGLMAIEMFLTPSGELLINELAPRPHNSGHHTIRANATSQYEQHVRAILGLPLGATDTLVPSAMVNLLGADGSEGQATYVGIQEALAIPGVYPHIYGKSNTKPFRKMGHVTVLDTDVEALKAKARKVKDLIRVEGETPKS